MMPLALAVALVTVGAHAATSSQYLTVRCAPAKGINLAAKAGNPASSPRRVRVLPIPRACRRPSWCNVGGLKPRPREIHRAFLETAF
jgi:hypothetical protein